MKITWNPEAFSEGTYSLIEGYDGTDAVTIPDMSQVSEFQVTGTDLEQYFMLVWTSGDITDVDDPTSLLPDDFQLYQNYPNPFNPTTEMAFYLPTASHARLEIFNIKGQKIETLADDWYESGEHRVIWKATDRSSGIYFYRLKTENYSCTKKMIL